MAEKKDEEREVDDEDDESSEDASEKSESDTAEGGDDAPVRAEGGEEEEASPSSSPGDALAKREPSELAEGGDLDSLAEGEVAAAQLGTDRYVMAGFFAAGMVGGYVLGRTIELAWTSVANRDWFSRTLPWLAAVPDEAKGTYSLVVAGIVAIILVIRTYKKPEVRTWSEEVATELTKVKWPTRKEVTNSTVIVIAASAVATIYLALLDRLWAFVTGIVYGDGGV